MGKQPIHWSKIEWVNCYELYRATSLYESDDYLDFNDFKKRIMSDDSFYLLHQLKEGMEDPNYNPWQIRNQKKHLVKRRNVDYQAKDGWLCEVARKNPPIGSKVELGDIIFIAQKGYAIFAQGTVYKIRRKKFETFKGFVEYCLNDSNVVDNDYWIEKIRTYSKDTKTNTTYHILEYKLEYVKQFDVSYPLEERFLKRHSWYYLEDDFELKIPKVSANLTKHIPTKLREEIYHQYKIKINEHLIDIDHIVPADLGGPGNIIQNLAPISPSVNRRKSNRVPSKLFDLASKFNIKTPKKYRISHDLFYSDSKAKKIAREIIKKINQQPLEGIRSDYEQIRSFHFPGLM